MKKGNFNSYRTALQDGLDTRKFFNKIKKQWYLLLIFAIIGGAIGFALTKIYRSSYASTSTVLVNLDSKSQTLASLFGDQNPFGAQNSDLISQIGIVRSYTLNLKTLQKLNWNQSIFEKGIFYNKDLYLNEPFKVAVDNYNIQTKGVPVHIKVLSAEELEINVHEKAVVNDTERSIDITERVKFGGLFSNTYFNFIVQKVKGVAVEPGVEYIVYFNAVEQLANSYIERLNVRLADEDSYILYLTLEGQQPLRDVSYLNELVTEYIAFGLEEKNRLTDNTMRFINTQLVGISDSLKSASRNFTNFRSQNRIVDLGQEATLVVNNLEDIEGQEAASRMKMEYYDNIKRYLNDATQMKQLAAPSVVGITDPGLNALVVKLSDLYSQREVLSYSVQEKNPNLVSLDNEIQYTKKLLLENINNLVANNRSELGILGMRKQKVNDQLTRLPKTEQDLVEIKRGFDLNSELYTFLMRKRAEVGIAKSSNNPDARVLDRARLNLDSPIGPGKIQTILISVFGAMLIPLIGFFLTTYFSNRLDTIDDIEFATPLAIAGRIETNKFKTELPVVQYPNSTVTESFRNLRTNLYTLGENGKRNVIAVHSSTVGEGKSFTSANLAAILALNNEKVLLVEADLRKPRLQTIFSINKEVGLSSYLMGKASLEEVTYPTRIKGLSFIPAGAIPTYTSELLGNGKLGEFIKIVKSQYSFIVIDSVPTDILSDAAIIAKYADINLYMLRLNHSKKDQLNSVNKIAEEEVMHNMTLVVNDISSRVSKKKLKEYGYN